MERSLWLPMNTRANLRDGPSIIKTFYEDLPDWRKHRKSDLEISSQFKQTKHFQPNPDYLALNCRKKSLSSLTNSDQSEVKSEASVKKVKIFLPLK